ncbi:MAG: DUF2079 domain-containing protein [Patescibacteria group bacterium]|jgi:uncharacterized membrane protein
MKRQLKNALKWLSGHQRSVLWVMILAYIGLFSALCLWKYGLYLYDSIDLAYFNQVFWNFLHGRWFEGSIHPHSSLGDHAELAIPFLLPFYAFFPDPRTLLVLQTVALALPAWPLFLIAERRFAARSLAPIAIAALWLASPLVQNINIYEFHILPFALLPLLFALREYDRGRLRHFLIFALLALVVREDVALVVVAFGVLAWIEKRSWSWRLAPVALGGVWFVAALRLIARFAPVGGYKYAIYYSWLGNTPAEMLLNTLTRPLRVLGHLFTFANLEMLLGFALPFALLLILLKPRRLILAALPLLQIILGAPGGGELILRTHYSTLFLPALFAAALDGQAALPKFAARLAKRGLPDARLLLTALLVFAALYGNLVLGPLKDAAVLAADGASRREQAAAADDLLARVGPQAAVAASYAFLPQLSSREYLYSLHYQFLGVTQFALTPYTLPSTVRYVALDTDDLLNYQAQFLRTDWTKPHYAGGYARLREAAKGGAVFARENLILIDNLAAPADLAAELTGAPYEFASGITLDSWGLRVTGTAGEKVIALATAWSATAPVAADLAMRVRLKDSAGQTVYDRAFPLGGGLTPTSEIAQRQAVAELNLPAASLADGWYYPEISLELIDSRLVLGPLGSTRREIMARKNFGAAALPPLLINGQ